MRNLLMAAVAIWSFIGGVAHADTRTNDEVFANAALRELHDLAVATARYAQAAKDSDDLGSQDAYKNMQKAAHAALVDMHDLSFTPIDAIENVSDMLRLGHLAQNGNEFAVTGLSISAGQAIVRLRVDYTIGDGDWYSINAKGDVEARNPLHYAQSLKEQNYSRVDVRSKDELVIGVSDWKAEMASHEVDDPSIKDSGNNLKAVEVNYRKNSDDNNTTVHFYRTKEDALAAAQAAKQQADADSNTAAELRASDAEWSEKLVSVPYMAANHDVGFKLVYAVCKAGKNTKGENICSNDGSHDWSDNRSVPYRWFSGMQECSDAQQSIGTKHPADVKVEGDDTFMSDCVPASKMSGHTLRGYEMVFALSAPGADYGDAAYADLRQRGSQTATVFKTFKSCYDAMDTAYSMLMKDLGVDEDGNLLNDKTKSISLTATCARVY